MRRLRQLLLVLACNLHDHDTERADGTIRCRRCGRAWVG